MTSTMTLNKSMQKLAELYLQEGYCVVSDLLNREDIKALCLEAEAVISGERGKVIGTSVLNENEALMKQVLCVHFPHKASKLLFNALSHPKIIPILRCLIGQDIKCMQSMLFAKNAGKPGQAWHQDEFYIPTRDRSLCGVWIAMDDATIENGCLWIHPGSQQKGILWPMQQHQDARFDASYEAFNFPYQGDGIPVEVRAGSVVFFNGYTLHRSMNNKNKKGYRRALVNHYMNARSLLPWGIGGDPCNDFRDIVMVAGEDPYNYKGIDSINFPFIRAEDPQQSKKIVALVKEERTIKY